jgi:hypothetical protein
MIYVINIVYYEKNIGRSFGHSSPKEIMLYLNKVIFSYGRKSKTIYP